MPEYIPSPRDWVREQVELYERTNGAEGNTLRDTGLPVIIVTHVGNKTGAIRKTPLMRVNDGTNYVLVGSMGGAPKDPVWVHNLRAKPQVELRDLAVVQEMCGRIVPWGMKAPLSWIMWMRRPRILPSASSAISQSQYWSRSWVAALKCSRRSSIHLIGRLSCTEAMAMPICSA